jgi:ferritin-like metal-binding protein YciE
MIRTMGDPSLSSDMSTHLEETREHAERVKACLEAHGRSPSRVRELTTTSLALLKAPLDQAHHEKGMRNARDRFAT